MTSEKSKFRFSAQEGVIELEGSEEFVTSHMETLTDLVRVISRHTHIETKSDKVRQEDTPSSSGPGDDDDAKDDEAKGIDAYPKVFAQISEKLKIICKIPGSNKREQSRNAALLYCYGSELIGDEQVPSSEIRTLCEEHGFLDAANFSKIFDDKTTFLLDGKKGGNKKVKLTFTGREKAVALVNELSE